MKPNYIEELGVFKAKVNGAVARGPKEKSKAACYIEFSRVSDGSISSMRLNNPLAKSDFFKISKVVKAITGTAYKIDELEKFPQDKLIDRLNQFKDQVVNIYVTPFEIPNTNKTMWNVDDVQSGKYATSLSAPSSVANSEDIPF